MSGRRTKIEGEKMLDQKLKRTVEAMGGECFKLLTTHISGLPDRLCLFRGGTVVFAEIKTTREKPRKLQNYWLRKLNNLGFKSVVVDSSKDIEEIVNYAEKRPIARLPEDSS